MSATSAGPKSNATAGAGAKDSTTGVSGKGTPQTSEIQFTDVSSTASIRDFFHNGEEGGEFTILESLGGGSGVFDFDLDGALDIAMPTGGEAVQKDVHPRGLPTFLYRGDGAFHFADVTNAARIEKPRVFTHGIAAADYDSDGFIDFVVTGYGALQLFHNCGDGTFQEVSQSVGLTDTQWSSSAAWGDLNNDGYSDLYVAHYVDWSWSNHPLCPGPKPHGKDICPPYKFTGLQDIVYFNNGDGTFRDATESAGLVAEGKGLGAIIGDVDLDGDVDVYVANDTVSNFLYQNDGTGKLTEVGDISGTSLSAEGTPDGSMGLWFTDIDLDGLPDLWVANYERESIAFYRNEQNCLFQHVSRRMGVTAVGKLFVSFGTVYFDADGDEDEDGFVVNGHVIRFPTNSNLQQPPLLFENMDGRRLVNVAPVVGGYFTEARMARGLSYGDLDNDGDFDLLITSINEPVAVLSNTSPRANHAIRVKLIGTRSNRDAIGAKLELETSRGKQTRQVLGGGSYLCQCDTQQAFGLRSDTTPKQLIIRWPSGVTETITDLRIGELITVVEPAGESVAAN